MNIWLGEKRGYVTDWITQRWVQLTGKKVDLRNEQWLLGPMGNTKKIGEDFFMQVAADENLEITVNENNSGLLKDLDVLKNGSSASFHPKVRDFYAHTINYSFDVWSEWCGFFKPFGWMLAVIFSRRLQQLNVPLSPMDTSHGVTSDIIQLKEKPSGEPVYRIWMRKKIASKDVIYAGCYGWCKPPNVNYNCIKVVFPLPNGNCTVIMTPTVGQDGSLKLLSKGNGYGDPGFYFTIKKSEKVYYARFVKTMRETINVYEDEQGTLRTDHTLTIWGTTFLKLHYKIHPKSQ
jgi:hypothetical protein